MGIRRGALIALFFGAAGVARAQQDCPLAKRWEPSDPGNYTASGPHHIDFVVIHTVEGTKTGCINWFKNPAAKATAQFVVGFDGEIVQMVAEHDIAWHAGNWGYNTRAIGIEHEGYAGQNLWTEDQLNASSTLTAYLCKKYGIPADRQHIIGHKDVPNQSHWDPGPQFDWDGYLGRVQQKLSGKAAAKASAGGPSRQERQKLWDQAMDAEQKKAWAKATEALQRLAFDGRDPEFARRAKDKLAAYERDPAIAAVMKSEAAKRECQRWMSLGRTYAINGMPGLALPFFKKAVELYPKGGHIDECRQRISEIQQRLGPDGLETESGKTGL